MQVGTLFKHSIIKLYMLALLQRISYGNLGVESRTSYSWTAVPAGNLPTLQRRENMYTALATASLLELNASMDGIASCCPSCKPDGVLAGDETDTGAAGLGAVAGAGTTEEGCSCGADTGVKCSVAFAGGEALDVTVVGTGALTEAGWTPAGAAGPKWSQEE